MPGKLRIVYGMDEEISQAIKESGLSQRQLAERCGCERKTIMALKNGQSGTSILILARLCSALNISADWVLGLKREKERDK